MGTDTGKTGGAGDPPTVEQLMALCDDLRGQLATVTGARDAALGDLEAAGKDKADALAELATAKDQLTTVIGERDDGRLALDAERKAKSEALVALDQARNDLALAKRQASVVAKAKKDKARAAVPMDELADKQALLERVRSGLFEVAFSDGEHEIIALPPISIAPDAWQLIGRGVLLREPVTIKPDRRIVLAGFALFDGDGHQIAWCAMASEVPIEPGQAMRLDRQIVF